ncbi:MAG: hypothetical protein PHR06_05030 [Candidatus Cloacimonetes bacterium]|nr:hypothetical protein [Candidatus Cloacimonadota bacterium]
MKMFCLNHKTILFLSFVILLTTVTALQAVDNSSFVVEDLRVEDIPNDDGTGLMISWKPLPKEKRIIEYRVYRGVTTDSLFYIGKIDVNVNTGVTGERVFFYDKDLTLFSYISSIGKLKKEKQQSIDSPLYRGYPRDISVTGKELKNYTVYAVSDEKDYFYNHTKTELTKGDDTEIVAGLKLKNINYLLKQLKTDKEYFYTVVAVNEARTYYPYAEPASGFPRENAPEKTMNFHSVYLEDKNTLNFEWNLPIFKDDVRFHSVYLLAKADLEKFQKYENYLIEKEKYDISSKSDSTIVAPEPVTENPLQLIYRTTSSYPFPSMNSATVSIENSRIVDVDNAIDVEFDPSNVTDYLFLFSLQDYASYETFSPAAEAKISQFRAIPGIASLNDQYDFVVEDVINDKGDYNKIMWGKPVVRITNTSYANKNKTSLNVNYEIFTNEYYRINNIYFKFYDSNYNELDRVNEFYQDNRLKIKIPEGINEIITEITFKTNRDMGDYVLTQKLIYKEDSRSLRPGKIMEGDEAIEDYSYMIYKRNYSSANFRLAKKENGVSREYEDYIAFETAFFNPVTEYDEEKNMYFVSPAFAAGKDQEKNTIVADLFAENTEKRINLFKKELDKYTAMRDTLKEQSDIDSANEAIEYYQEQIDFFKNNEVLKAASEIKSPKNRIKYLQQERTKANRSFEYKIVKTDGKGRYIESEVFRNEDGQTHFIPVGNWLNTDMIPTFIASFIFGLLVWIMISKARRGHDLYIRPIAGIQEIDNAIGRATEMGRPILFVPGLSGISDVATLAGLSILGRVAKKAAEYDTRILVPVRDYIVLPIAQEIVKEAHYEAGRPDTYDKGSVFFLTTAQFPFVAGVNGIMIREKTATNFYMGMFWAEALIMTETGSSTGAIQISGTDAVTQIPFFITTCDYTLIGEELYAASAYLAREPLMLGTLKAQDYTKLLILLFIIAGTLLSTVHLTFLINAFPDK